ncbi:hypothetical protein BGZ54_000538 [Gamsiella multidivaricata]|nr:hypothetical protein BGZ54_000538 [Gamsiella multidivaricata]
MADVSPTPTVLPSSDPTMSISPIPASPNVTATETATVSTTAPSVPTLNTTTVWSTTTLAPSHTTIVPVPTTTTKPSGATNLQKKLSVFFVVLVIVPAVLNAL